MSVIFRWNGVDDTHIWVVEIENVRDVAHIFGKHVSKWAKTTVRPFLLQAINPLNTLSVSHGFS